MNKQLINEMPHIGTVNCPYCQFKFYADPKVELFPLEHANKEKLFKYYLKNQKIAFPCPKCHKDIVYDNKSHKTLKYDQIIDKVKPDLAKFLNITKGYTPPFVTMDQVEPVFESTEPDHLTFEKFAKVLNEAPLPDDWDQEVYTPKVSFAKQVKYAVERAKKLGTGSSRVVFTIEYQGRPTALKIAKNKKGLAQNEREADYGLYQMYPDITTPLIDYDEVNHPPLWIHVEKADKLTASKFKAITGYSFENFGNMLHADESRRGVGRVGTAFWSPRIPDEIKEQIKEQIENSELYYDVTSLMGNFDILAGDLTRLANWGIYKGKPVIIDLGFSSDVQKQHYS